MYQKAPFLMFYFIVIHQVSVSSYVPTEHAVGVLVSENSAGMPGEHTMVTTLESVSDI